MRPIYFPNIAALVPNWAWFVSATEPALETQNQPNPCGQHQSDSWTSNGLETPNKTLAQSGDFQISCFVCHWVHGWWVWSFLCANHHLKFAVLARWHWHLRCWCTLANAHFPRIFPCVWPAHWCHLNPNNQSSHCDVKQCKWRAFVHTVGLAPYYHVDLIVGVSIAHQRSSGRFCPSLRRHLNQNWLNPLHLWCTFERLGCICQSHATNRLTNLLAIGPIYAPVFLPWRRHPEDVPQRFESVYSYHWNVPHKPKDDPLFFSICYLTILVCIRWWWWKNAQQKLI